MYAVFTQVIRNMADIKQQIMYLFNRDNKESEYLISKVNLLTGKLRFNLPSGVFMIIHIRRRGTKWQFLKAGEIMTQTVIERGQKL